MLRKGTFIISAFPGCGKSYCTQKFIDKFYILDADAIDYRYIKDSDGNVTDERNPEFPINNIEYIKKYIGVADIIFVSNFTRLRRALKKNDIKVIVVYPDKNLREDFMDRYSKRGNDNEFIDFMNENWNYFINEIEEENLGFLKYKLTKENPFITLEYIESLVSGSKQKKYINY